MNTKSLFNIVLLMEFSIISVVVCAQHPTIDGYNVYYGSLHNHSNVSDGTGTPDEAYYYAKNTAKLDFFGLADHSNMMTATEWTTIKTTADEYNEMDVFAAFYSFEWTSYSSYGHVTVTNTEDYCSTELPTNTFSGLLDWINDRDGIAFFNHPGWEASALQEFNHFTDTPSDKFVGIELWCGMSGFSKYYYNDGYYFDDGGKSYYDEALIRNWKIGAAGSDDNHYATWGTRTDFRVGVLANSLSREEILNAFKARRFFSTLDKNLSLSFKINGSQMGSTLDGGSYSMEIRANDSDGEIFDQIVLVKNGAVFKTWYPFSNQPVIIENLTCSDGDYYYIRVKQNVDGDEAITSPIFISGTINQSPVVEITNPTGGTIFNAGETISIYATASDPDGSVAKVEFYAGTTTLGEDLTTPYQFLWNNAAIGNYNLTAKVFDNLGASVISAPINISVIQSGTVIMVSSAITSGNDDAEETQNGVVNLTDSDIDMVYERKTGNRIVGLLFRNLNIPKGAAITKAYVQFTTSKITTNFCLLTITGEATDNPDNFLATSKNLSSRLKTTAKVTWLPQSWISVNLRDKAQQTEDIKSIIQEIVNRPAWTSDKIALFITGTGTRTADSYESFSAKPATIYVEYTYMPDIVVPSLAISPANIALDYSSGANGTFDITSNTNWSITDDASWLDVSPVSGSNNGTITVTANSANIESSPRTATITIAGTGVTQDKTVTVTQEAEPAGGSTLGNTEVYSSSSTTANRRAIPITVTEAGSINSISIYHNGGTGNVLLGIYSGDTGILTTLLGVTSSTAINSSAGWQTVPLTSPVTVTSGQTVWLSWVFENNPGIRYVVGTPARAQSPELWSGGMPSTFGTASFANYKYSIYCTYTPEGTTTATLGNSTEYSLTSTTANRRAIPVTFSEAGEINSISIYHNGGSGNVLLGVYSGDTGIPSSLLGLTASTVINSSAGWQTVSLNSPVVVTSGQTVWLSWVFENNPGIRYIAGTPARAQSSDLWSGGMPITFGAASFANYKYSIYCTYTTINANERKSVEIVTGAIEYPQFEAGDLKVYPNPFSEKLNFEFVSANDAQAVLEIYNMLGQKIVGLMNQQVEGGVMNRIEYAPTDIISGNYIYKLTLDGNTKVGKVIYKKY